MYAFLADIHIGTKLKHIDYLKALDNFLTIIKKHKEPCHCIFVCGDVFDHILSVLDARFASLFLLNLVCNRCSRLPNKTNVPVHFIHGTYTHDYDQYETYLNILEKIDNVEIFYTKEICSGTLINGKSVLYIPQVYGDVDTKDFINKDKHYDIIIGHGPINSLTKSPCKSSNREIVYPVELLGDISNVCVFGHYHGYTDFENNVYYAGSFLRWQYGEPEEKCFVICNDDYSVETYRNDMALEYKTIVVEDPEQLRDMISKDITTPHRFVIKPTTDNLSTYHSIMSVNKDQNITYKLMNITDTEVIPEETQSIHTNDNAVGPVESLIVFIQDKYNIDVSNEIQEYVSKIEKE